MGCVPGPGVCACSRGVPVPGGSGPRGCLVLGGCLVPGRCLVLEGCLVPGGGGSVPGGAWWRPPRRRLLLQGVRMLLECILITLYFSLNFLALRWVKQDHSLSEILNIPSHHRNIYLQTAWKYWISDKIVKCFYQSQDTKSYHLVTCSSKKISPCW